jgi:hypothetical protein
MRREGPRPPFTTAYNLLFSKPLWHPCLMSRAHQTFQDLLLSVRVEPTFCWYLLYYQYESAFFIVWNALATSSFLLISNRLCSLWTPPPRAR